MLAAYLVVSFIAGALWAWLGMRWNVLKLRVQERRIDGLQRDLGELEENVGGLRTVTNSLVDLSAKHHMELFKYVDPNGLPTISFRGAKPPKGEKMIVTVEREQEGIPEKSIWKKMEITDQGVKDVTPQE